jgi:hypothetical protein
MLKRFVSLFGAYVFLSILSPSLFAEATLILSFSSIALEEGERIVAFELHTSNAVISVDKMPEDWAVHIVPEGATTTVYGGTVHGAGALFSASELPRLTIRTPTARKEISVEAVVHTTADFRTTRKIKQTLVAAKED